VSRGGGSAQRCGGRATALGGSPLLSFHPLGGGSFFPAPLSFATATESSCGSSGELPVEQPTKIRSGRQSDERQVARPRAFITLLGGAAAAWRRGWLQ